MKEDRPEAAADRESPCAISRSPRGSGHRGPPSAVPSTVGGRARRRGRGASPPTSVCVYVSMGGRVGQTRASGCCCARPCTCPAGPPGREGAARLGLAPLQTVHSAVVCRRPTQFPVNIRIEAGPIYGNLWKNGTVGKRERWLGLRGGIAGGQQVQLVSSAQDKPSQQAHLSSAGVQLPNDLAVNKPAAELAAESVSAFRGRRTAPHAAPRQPGQPPHPPAAA